eukprot:TRINITY_DN1111_c0_g2_i1.p1 TRINITY_DN1111_c0_g2~~TRINITY_DN1111_c0_g2_i1.p1  ORF type:complete len:314 (+),score=64.59 TRINITY_DN1111_c0_g2_i1:330-1271(+)
MPSYVTSEGTFKSEVDGLQLAARRWSPADGEVKAVIVIAHGYMEHCGRYEKLAEGYCSRGWAIYTMDHRGHGKSADVDKLRAFFWKFAHIVDEFAEFMMKVLDAHTHYDLLPFDDILAGAAPHETNTTPVVPIFVHGHSMGGLATCNYLIDKGKYKKLKGVVLSSPFFAPAESVNCLSKNMGTLASKLMPKLLVAKIADNSTSRNMEECEKYNTDPLNTRASITCNVAKEFLAAQEVTYSRMDEIKIPILFIQGTADKLVSASVTEDFYKACASADKKLTKYKDAGHELINELPETAAEAIKEVTEWIESHLE